MEYYNGGIYEKKDLGIAEEKARKMLLSGHDAFIKRLFQGGTIKYKVQVSMKKKPGRIPKEPKVEILG
jgi:hypothetical protein